MKIAEVQINLWEKPQEYIYENIDLNIGDYVVVETDTAKEIGKIINQKEIDDKAFKAISESQEEELKSIIRKANLKDLEKLENYEKNKKNDLDVCRNLIEKQQLPMKLVDVHNSLDNKKITFAFIAEGRVDFRGLVKDLTRNFQKNIRLQQLGVRDEAKVNGDIGVCGLVQCCRTHLKELGNVSAEQAELQQISHRGAERLSGICNRLKCCLRYENDLYKDIAVNFPQLGDMIKTPQGKGEVIERHILKQTVNVRLERDKETIIEVSLSKNE